MLIPMPTPPSSDSPSAAGESKFIMLGTLRGAGEEKAARCFCGVFVEGVGVVILGGSGRVVVMGRYVGELELVRFRISITVVVSLNW